MLVTCDSAGMLCLGCWNTGIYRDGGLPFVDEMRCAGIVTRVSTQTLQIDDVGGEGLVEFKGRGFMRRWDGVRGTYLLLLR